MRALALLLILAGSANAFGDKSAKQYLDSCLKGDDNDCNTIGYMHAHGIDAPFDFGRARDLFQIACNRGSATGCYNLGGAYERGEGAPLDFKKAAKLYSQACEAGALIACLNLGVMAQQAHGMPRNPRKAAALFAKACETDESKLGEWNRGLVGSGCNNLANLYEAGDGVGKDLAKASRLFSRACALGDKDGCNGARRIQTGVEATGNEIQRTEYNGNGPIR